MRQKMNSYGKTWHTWDASPGAKLPLGPPGLAWSFSRFGEADPAVIADRDRRPVEEVERPSVGEQDIAHVLLVRVGCRHISAEDGAQHKVDCGPLTRSLTPGLDREPRLVRRKCRHRARELELLTRVLTVLVATGRIEVAVRDGSLGEHGRDDVGFRFRELHVLDRELVRTREDDRLRQRHPHMVP